MKATTTKTAKLHIRTGDTVKVLTGADRGKTGKVLEIMRDKQKAIVEGVNMKHKHQKPNAQNPEGGISQSEAGIHISNLMVVDPASGEASRIGRKLNDQGKLQRYSKKNNGQFINNG
jgi:large subunit ribosomal protein L24